MTTWFDSNAAFWAAIAALAMVVAVTALVGDLRRTRRRDPDAVGVMPWTAIFLAAFFVAAVAALFALADWLSPI